MAKTWLVELACKNSDGTLKQQGTVRYQCNSVEQVIGKAYAALQALAVLNPECKLIAEFLTDTDTWCRLEHVADYALLEAHATPPQPPPPDFPDYDATKTPW